MSLRARTAAGRGAVVASTSALVAAVLLGAPLTALADDSAPAASDGQPAAADDAGTPGDEPAGAGATEQSTTTGAGSGSEDAVQPAPPDGDIAPDDEPPTPPADGPQDAPEGAPADAGDRQTAGPADAPSADDPAAASSAASSLPGPGAVDGAEEDDLQAFADFGLGKVVFQVEGLEGTPFPADADLSGATLRVEYEADGFVFEISEGGGVPSEGDGEFVCTTDADGLCDRALFAAAGELTVTVTQLTAPAGFLVPDDPVRTLDDDGVCAPVDEEEIEGLDCSITVQDPGVFRTLGVDLRSRVDGRPLAGGGFELTPPGGTDPVDDVTTGADGTGLFEGLFLPGAFSVDQTDAPQGYVAETGTLPFAVPAATSVAQARQPVLLPVRNAADVPPPTARDDAASTDRDRPVDVPVLANDDGAGAPLAVASVGAVRDGSVEVVGGVLRFTPASGFAGTTSFTYTASTRGGSDTATVTVTVVAPATRAAVAAAPVRSTAALPRTGADLGPLLATSAGLLGGGGLLLLGGRRQAARREQQR